MSKHTPGPWPKPEQWIEYLKQENKRLADLNADMLAVLKDIASRYQKDLARNPQLCPLLRPASFGTIRAAIAKAEGAP